MNSNLIEKKQIRKFGLIAFVFFAILCALGIWAQKNLTIYLFSCLSILGIGFMVAPVQLTPVYKAWLRVGHLLGRAVNTLILIFIYYLVITPASLLKRVMGGRPLPLQPDRAAASYWVTKPEPAQPKERFLKRY
jgi:hypothetical protein